MSKWIHVKHDTPEVPKCDFCSQEAVVVCFVATQAAIGMEGEVAIEIEPGQPKVKKVILDSDAHWAACEPCAGLVRAGDRDALRERSYDRAPAEVKESPSGYLSLGLIQDTMFWAGFTGTEHGVEAHLPRKEGE